MKSEAAEKQEFAAAINKACYGGKQDEAKILAHLVPLISVEDRKDNLGYPEHLRDLHLLELWVRLRGRVEPEVTAALSAVEGYRRRPKNFHDAARMEQMAGQINMLLFDNTRPLELLKPIAFELLQYFMWPAWMKQDEEVRREALQQHWATYKRDPKWANDVKAAEQFVPIAEEPPELVKIAESLNEEQRRKLAKAQAREQVRAEIADQRAKLRRERDEKKYLKELGAAQKKKEKEERRNAAIEHQKAVMQIAFSERSSAEWTIDQRREALLKRTLYHAASKSFFSPEPDGRWERYSEKEMEEAFSIHCGLPIKVRGEESGSVAPAAKMRHQISRDITRKLDGVVEVSYLPLGFLDSAHVGDRKILNTAINRVVRPAEKAGTYGESFPWIADGLNNFFGREHDDGFQWELFNATLRIAYAGALTEKPKLIPSIFFAGDPSAGKGLMTMGVLRTMFGGSAEDPHDWLLGDEKWNDNLARAHILVSNDPVLEWAKTSRLAKALKKLSSEAYMTIKARWASNQLLPFYVPKFFTLNRDAESRAAMTIAGLTDKVQVYRVYPFKKRAEEMEKDLANERIKQELPHYLAWLLSWEPSARAQTTQMRWGGALPWIHPEFRERSDYSAEVSDVRELVLSWIETYRTPVFKGTATEIKRELERSGFVSVGRDPRTLGVGLARIAESGEGWIERGMTRGLARYTIDRNKIPEPNKVSEASETSQPDTSVPL